MIKEVVKSVRRSVSQLAHKADQAGLEACNLGKHRETETPAQDYEHNTATLQVSQQICQGYLRKQTQTKKTISSFPARYYQLDRETGQLKIYPFATSQQPPKIMGPGTEQELILVSRGSTEEQGENRPDDFPFSFSLQTNERDFILFAATEEERNIWVGELEQWQSIKTV